MNKVKQKNITTSLTKKKRNTITMKPHYITTFLILSFFPSFSAQSNPNSPNFNSQEKNNRRILHQPFFPSTSSPPPLQIPDLPDPDLQDPDHPFFHELPPGPPPPSLQASGTAVANLVTTQKSKQNKKLAIGITSGILTLAVLATLAFYVHKQRSKNKDDSQKPFNGNSQNNNQESQSQIPPSNFLYIGTVEPSARSVVNDTNIAHNGSPYRKLNSGKRSNFYRPSPDLQPLPPLTKPPPSPPLNSPPPMSSSDDDESQETSFYTPNGSHSSKQSYNSKRTKPVIIPSIKQSMPYSYTPKRTKFSPPPPPPPPPPGPPVLSIPRKFGPVIRPEPIIPTPKETPRIEKASSLEEKDGSKPKLKPLHWDKVRATSERATVWDQIKSSSFQLNEDAIETLFGCNSASSVPKEAIKKPFLEQEIRVLDPKKSQNIAILLRALNVTREEISEALLDGNPEGLGSELLETLVKMAPTKEEEIKLKDYNGEISKLGSAERFLKAILDIPFAYKRVEAMLYRANFDTEVNYLRMSFQTLEEASQELKNSRLFLKLLEAVLRTGNRMNDGTNRGDARAFKLDTLLKLVDVKGTDGKTTLLHFVVQEIIRADKANSNPINKDEEFKKQSLEVVSGLSQELGNVKKAAGMDSDVLSGYVSKLEMGLEKVKLVLQYEKQSVKQGKFFGSMKEFLKEAGEEISVVKAEERKALSLVKEATQYFHGDAAKEEAHPFRIFMIVRDFLSILDKVCRDVGRMQDRTTMGTGRSFRIPVTASLPVLNRYNIRKDTSSDGDSM